MTQRIKLKNQRPKALWGALVSSLVNLAGGVYSANKQASIAKQQAEQQERLTRQQAELMNNNNLATTMNNYYNSLTNDDENYRLQYEKGGKVRRTLGNTVSITDGGIAIPIKKNVALLQGGSHEDINETGQTGIGIKFGNKIIEGQGGEAIEKKGKELRIYTAEPIYSDGSSATDHVLAGENTDKVFEAQSRFNHRRLASRPVEERTKAKWGMSTVGSDYLNLGGDVLSAIGTWAFGNKALNATRDLLNKPINIPQRTSIIAPSLDTRYHNEAQLAEVERNRERARNLIRGNSASSAVGLSRMQTADTDAMTERNKLHDERINKEAELRNKNAEMQFEVAKANAANASDYDKMRITAEMDRYNKLYEFAGKQADFTTNVVSGLGAAINNFITQGQQRYEDENALKAYLAASGPGTASTMQAMGYRFTPNMNRTIFDMQQNYYKSNPNDKDAITRYNIAGRTLYGDKWNDIGNKVIVNNNKTTINDNNIPMYLRRPIDTTSSKPFIYNPDYLKWQRKDYKWY